VNDQQYNLQDYMAFLKLYINLQYVKCMSTHQLGV